ncbi:unnamed protein product [Urochloa humidicola]
MKSWEGILCAEMWVRPPAFVEHVPSSYLILNPITRACAVAPAPAIPGGGSNRGYIAGAYSHPVTVFHLLHSSGRDSGGGDEQAPRFRVQTVDSLNLAQRSRSPATPTRPRSRPPSAATGCRVPPPHTTVCRLRRDSPSRPSHHKAEYMMLSFRLIQGLFLSSDEY